MRSYQFAVAAAAALGVAAGCGPKSQTPAKVSGTVTYKGQPLKGGNITFHSEDKGNYNGSINEDGTYAIFDVPTGTMKVSIDTEFLNPDRKIPDYATTKGRGGKGGGPTRGREARPPSPRGP